MPSKKTLQPYVNLFQSDYGTLRVVEVQKEIYFAMKDVCLSVGIGNVTKASANVDKEDMRRMTINTAGGKQRLLFVNESGLYQLIFMGKTDRAKSFRRLVTSEILPSIRKTGKYALPSWVKDEEEMNEIQRMVDNFLGKTDNYPPIDEDDFRWDIGK